MDSQATHPTSPGEIHLSSLGNRITEVRSRRHLSRRQLAQLAGLRPERVSRLEKGKVDPRLQEIAKLAAVLGTGLEALAYGGGRDEDLERVAAQKRMTAQQAELALRAMALGLATLQQQGGEL